MTTYRFPESLGAGEHEAAADVSEYPKVGFNLSDLTERLWLYRSDLTVVTPPLPEEPDPGAVVLDRDLRAWQYVGDGRGDWCCTVDDLGADWEELNREHGPLTRLIPAPVVEPVTLPWKALSLYGGDGARVEPSVNDGYVFVNGGHLKPDAADAMAAALTTAAAKARQS